MFYDSLMARVTAAAIDAIAYARESGSTDYQFDHDWGCGDGWLARLTDERHHDAISDAKQVLASYEPTNDQEADMAEALDTWVKFPRVALAELRNGYNY